MTQSRFRWGIVGTSEIAARFAQQLAHTREGVCHGVASRSSERAEQFARRHGCPRVFPSYEALVASPEIDVVYVATPTRDHLEHCLLALDHDKALLCEKPLAQTLEEGERVVETARRRGVFCMEAMWMRFHPLVQELRDLVQRGELGEIHSIRAELGWSKPLDRVEDPSRGRGAVLDFGVYPISFVHFLLGVPARVEVNVRRHASGGDETVSALLVYPGCTASIAASVRVNLANDAVVVGSRKTARLGRPLLAPRWLEVTDSARGASPATRALQVARRVLSPWQLSPRIGLRREAEEVMRCLQEGRTESAIQPLDATLDTLRCADLLRNA